MFSSAKDPTWSDYDFQHSLEGGIYVQAAPYGRFQVYRAPHQHQESESDSADAES
jgi:hypothetical protein